MSLDFSHISGIEIPEGAVSKIEKDGTVLWQKGADWKGLTFTALEASTVYLATTFGTQPNAEYSFDGVTWATFPRTQSTRLNLTAGQIVYVRGYNPNGFSEGTSFYTIFTMTGSIAASGSVMSLIDRIGETLTIPNDYCFYGLFQGCGALKTAPELPATTLKTACYGNMFSSCGGLTSAPDLPATTLAQYCYNYMFQRCTGLINPPATLQATTLSPYCYSAMFYQCTAMKKTPSLPATALVTYCYYNMFSGCSSLKVNENGTGTKIFTCPSNVPSNSVTNMFTGTSGTFKSTPTKNNSYYWYE